MDKSGEGRRDKERKSIRKGRREERIGIGEERGTEEKIDLKERKEEKDRRTEGKGEYSIR